MAECISHYELNIHGISPNRFTSPQFSVTCNKLKYVLAAMFWWEILIDGKQNTFLCCIYNFHAQSRRHFTWNRNLFSGFAIRVLSMTKLEFPLHFFTEAALLLVISVNMYVTTLQHVAYTFMKLKFFLYVSILLHVAC